MAGYNSSLWSAIFGLVVYGIRMQVTVHINPEPIYWKKYKNIGVDFVVLGMGTIIGAIARLLGDKTLPAQYTAVVLVTLFVATGYWILMYSFTHPKEERLALAKWLGRTLGREAERGTPPEKDWVISASWMIRFVIHLIMGFAAYVTQLWVALIWANSR